MNIYFKSNERLSHAKLSRKSTYFQTLHSEYNISTFGDITTDALNSLKYQDLDLFYKILRILALYDFHFEGVISNYNIEVDHEQYFYTKESKSLKEVVENPTLCEVLDDYGFVDLPSLIGINLYKLDKMLLSYSPVEIVNPAMKEISLYNYSVANKGLAAVPEGKVIKIQEQFIMIEKEKLDHAFVINDSSLKVLADDFTRSRIQYFRDIPGDLDYYLSKVRGIGTYKKRLFKEYLEKYEQIQHLNTITTTSVINTIFKARQAKLKTKSQKLEKIKPNVDPLKIGKIKMNNRVLELAPEILELPINFTCMPNAVMASVLKKARIYYFKELPYDFDSIFIGMGDLAQKKAAQFEKWLQKLTVEHFAQTNHVDSMIKAFEDIFLVQESTFFTAQDIAAFSYKYNDFTGGSITLGQVARRFNLTRERVRKIINKMAENILCGCYPFILSLSVAFEEQQFFYEDKLFKNDLEADIDVPDKFRFFVSALLAEIDSPYVYDAKLRLFHKCDAACVNQLKESVVGTIDRFFSMNIALPNEHLEEKISEWTNSISVSKYPVQLMVREVLKEKTIQGTNFVFPSKSERFRGEFIYRVFSIYFPKGLALPREYEQLLAKLVEEFPFMKEEFDEEPEKNSRNLTAIIRRKALAQERGYFIPRGFSKIIVQHFKR